MNKNDIVKYSRPAAGEADLRFVLLDNPDEMKDERGCIVSIQSTDKAFKIKPIERVDVSELELVTKNELQDLKEMIAGAVKAYPKPRDKR